MTKIKPYKVILLVLLILIVGSSTIKNLYWPPIHYDSIAGYSLMGKAIAVEKTLNVSLFENGLAGNRGIYPPFYPITQAVCIWLGLSAKLPTTIFFCVLLCTFYCISKKYILNEIALLFTLVLGSVPELFSHSSLSLTNLPATVMVAGGFLFLYHKRWFASAIFYGLAGFTRPDAITFTICAVVWVLYNSERKHFLIYSIIALTPLIFWNIYLVKVIGIIPDRFGFNFSINKIFWMSKYVLNFMVATDSYGILFLLFPVALFASKFSHKKVALYIGGSFILFFAGYYFLDPAKMGCTPEKLMTAGLRRGLMYFVPLVLFYSMLVAQRLIDKSKREIRYKLPEERIISC